jgi:hypothetical protein
VWLGERCALHRSNACACSLRIIVLAALPPRKIKIKYVHTYKCKQTQSFSSFFASFVYATPSETNKTSVVVSPLTVVPKRPPANHRHHAQHSSKQANANKTQVVGAATAGSERRPQHLSSAPVLFALPLPFPQSEEPARETALAPVPVRPVELEVSFFLRNVSVRNNLRGRLVGWLGLF